jgi:cell cycle sensor histidine kinase DivJ
VEACLIALLTAAFLAQMPASSIVLAFPAEVVTVTIVCLVVMFAGFVADRGERHAAAQMRSQARAAAALDAVPDVVLWREASGDISFANASAHRILGLDRRDLDTQTLLERVNVGDRPAWLKAISDAGSAGRGEAAQLRIACGAEREVRLFSCHVSRVGADGALLIALSDITERMVAETLREDARREAERIASSKSQFLATMSHELRTPLNAIIGFSELLKTPGLIGPTDPRRDEYSRIIHDSGQHLLEVVNAILDMSKIESGMMVIENDRVNLPALLQSSRELVAVKAAQKSIAIIESIAPDLPDIVSDRRALKQVLLNLMSNAVKFTPEGGDVTVTAVRDREHIEIAVTDSGIGMSEDNLRQIGTPFFQVAQSYDRKHEGTGLGLSVVRGLVGLMGGSVLVESALGEGTRVALRLPVAGPGNARNNEPVKIETRIRPRRLMGQPVREEQDARRTA